MSLYRLLSAAGRFGRAIGLKDCNDAKGWIAAGVGDDMNGIQKQGSENENALAAARGRVHNSLGRWRELLQSVGAVQHYDPATILFSADTSGRRSFLLEEGAVAITHQLSTGKQVLLTLRSPGQIFGHGSHVLKHSFEVSAIALTRCVLRVFDTNWLVEQIKRGGEAGLLLLQQHASELSDSGSTLIEWIHLDAGSRLVRFLLQLAVAFGVNGGGEMRVDLPLSDGYFASLLGISAQQFSAVRRRLIDEGRIRHVRKTDTWILPPGKT